MNLKKTKTTLPGTASFLLAALLLLPPASFGQVPGKKYWNYNTRLIPWRMMPAVDPTTIRFEDLDKDGDPDLLYHKIQNDITVVWIDDDDDMKYTDTEGDADSDCLLIDRNKDGIFAGPQDFCIDWCDEDGDGKADIQVIVNNGKASHRNYFDWETEIMYILDEDKDRIMHYVNWNQINLLAWEHNGHSNFYEDYHGNTSFIKMHASTFRIEDLRYSWENPFIFYDPDGDGLSEMAVRLVNTPRFRPKDNSDTLFNSINPEYDVHYNGRIDYAGIAWDLDNDNGQGNEFDFDISLQLKGPGFDYRKMVHRFTSLKGLGKQAEFLFYDKRWRQLDVLIFPDRKQAWPAVFSCKNWTYASLVVDEDDDCNRWERVEFYEPNDLYLMGARKKGLDNNPQADAVGDRGEFDTDFSGKGQLYIGAFDGKLHLYGAEWGAWRIDQTAFSYQGFGGLYNRWVDKGRIQFEPSGFALIKYEDSDNNGFMDKVYYDLDGDQVFEDSVSFSALGLDDQQRLFTAASYTLVSAQAAFKQQVEKNWLRAQAGIRFAEAEGLQTHWYNLYKQPRTLQEKYDYSFWLCFYLYRDLRDMYKHSGREDRALLLDKAYYSGHWNLAQNPPKKTKPM